jgi:hypothetical protein
MFNAEYIYVPDAMRIAVEIGARTEAPLARTGACPVAAH